MNLEKRPSRHYHSLRGLFCLKFKNPKACKILSNILLSDNLPIPIFWGVLHVLSKVVNKSRSLKHLSFKPLKPHTKKWPLDGPSELPNVHSFKTPISRWVQKDFTVVRTRPNNEVALYRHHYGDCSGACI